MRECVHVQTRISLRCSRKNVLFLFQRPFVSLIICYYIVSSADNLFKQLGPRSDPAKLSCENGAHVKSRMSLRCWRGKFLFFKCTFLLFNTMRHGEILYMQLNNAMFIYFKMCSICKFFTIIVENIYIRFQSLVT